MNAQSNKYSRYMPYVAGSLLGGLAGASIFALYRWLNPVEPTLTPHVQENLPIAKDLKTIPDDEGNYDLDGASFDSDGVVIGSDKTLN